MLPASKTEFDEHTDALDAEPVGGKVLNVGTTSFYSRGQEVGRVINDGDGTRYKIQDFKCPLCGESYGSDAVHNDDRQLVCPHCAEVNE